MENAGRPLGAIALAALAVSGCPLPAVTSASNTSEVTLASCGTSVASDAPAFYRDFFKCVTVTNGSAGAHVTSSGLPPHKSYYYGAGNPNYAEFDTSRGSQYKANPNKLGSQTLQFDIPASPKAKSNLTIAVDHTANTSSDEYPMGVAGIALDGVAIFNDQAGPGDSIDNEQYTFDSYNGHPENRGTYHYHTVTPGPLEVLAALGLVTRTAPGSAELELYGIMCDGTVVLGCTELDGTAPSGTLDAQNGHVGDLKDKAGTVHFAGRYHTHVCPGKYAAHKYTPEIQYYDTCGKK